MPKVMSPTDKGLESRLSVWSSDDTSTNLVVTLHIIDETGYVNVWAVTSDNFIRLVAEREQTGTWREEINAVHSDLLHMVNMLAACSNLLALGDQPS